MLDEAEIQRKKNGTKAFSKKAINRANAYYNRFNKLKEDIGNHGTILNNAYKSKERYLDLYNLIIGNQANYNSVNEQYYKQKDNYNKIKPILESIFGIYLPNIVSRKLPELDKANSKMDELIVQFTIAGGAIESKVVPILEYCNKHIKQH